MEELQKLYNVLVRDGYYTQGIDEFTVQIQDPAYVDKVYGVVTRDGLYTKDRQAFESQYGLKKKEDTELPSPVGSLEQQEPVEVQEEIITAEQPEVPEEEGDAFKKFKANALEMASGISRIPMFVAENAINAATAFNPELQSYLDESTPEERDAFISSIAYSTGGVGMMGAGAANEAAKKLKQSAEEIQETITQYDTGITEDIFSENVGRGLSRLLDEAVGTAPSLALAFIPGGIGVIGAGSAAEKSRALQEKGEDLDYKTFINAVGSGTAEGIFENYTRKLIPKSIFKQLAGKTKEQALVTAKKISNSLLKGFGIEGGSETATLLSQKMLDAFVTGDEEAFVNIVGEALDTFLIGGVIGAPLNTLSPGIRAISQKRQRSKLNKIIDKSKYKDITEAFKMEKGKPSVELDQLEIISSPNSKIFLEGTLAKKVKNNTLSEAESKAILEAYDNAASLVYETSDLDISQDKKVEAMLLVDEKRKLENLIAGKDQALSKKERIRIDEINDSLEKISLEGGVELSIEEATKEDAIKALQEEGITEPSDKQILEKLDKLTKKEKDAIQESSAEGVVLREQARDGEGVGVKDSKPAEKITPQEETVAPTDQEITQEADVTELTEEEKLEKVTKEKVKKLVTAPRRITEPFKIGQTTVTLNEDGTIKSAVNSKGVPVKEAALKRVQKKVLESLIDIDSGKKAPAVKGIAENNIDNYILENSSNIREIAFSIKNQRSKLKDKKQLIEEAKDATKLNDLEQSYFTIEDLAKNYDKKILEEKDVLPGTDLRTDTGVSRNIRRYWTIPAKDKFGRSSIGVSDFALTAEGLGITPGELVDIIVQFPTRNVMKPTSGTIVETDKPSTLIELQEKFESLTGIAPAASIVDFVIGIEEGRVPLDLLKALEKEQLTRQAAEPVVFGKKRGPSAKKITSTPKKEITVDEIKALKDQIRLEAKAAREAKGDQTARRKAISNAINALKVVGKINLAKAKSLINKISTVDLNKAIQVEKALAYVEKVFTTADYDAKLSEAESLRKSIKNLSKTEKLDVYPVEAAKRFSEVDPVLVEDIESYIEEAKKVKDGVTPSTKTKTMPALDIKKTDEYTTSEVNKQKKIKLEAEKEVFQELTGLSPDEFSLQDMREIVNGVEQDQPADVREKELESKAKTNADVIKKGLNKTFNTVSTIVNQLIEAETDPFTGEIIELTKEQKKLVKDFLNIDINKLSDADAVIALDSLINFATNKTTGGMGAIVRRSKGNLNSQTFLNLGYKAIPLSVITDKIKIAGIISRGWNEYISSLPLMLETMFKGQSKAAAFERLSGLSELKRGASDGVTITKEITDRYSKAFFKKNRFGYLKTKANGEDFNTAFNNIERDMFARLKRTIPGEEQVEFKRIKGLIEQSIDVLKEANLDEKAKLYEEVYDKILKDSDNISEVESKVDKTNAEAVGWMINEWSKFYPKLNELNVNIYNKILNKEVDYTPVTFSSIEKTEKISEIGEPILEFSLKKISDKKTGVLMEAKRPTQLPKGRYLNLNFDSNNILALEKAVIDLKTAGAIQQLKGFFNSKDFLEIVPSSNDRKILTDRVIELVEAKRGRNYINNDSKEILKSLNSYSLFGVSRTLGSVSQAVKQTVPVYINTIINAGPEYTLKATNMVSTNPDINKLINNSGYSIANRGIESITNLESINSKIESAASGNAEATVRAVNKLQSMWLQGFLVKPDRAIARLSWWAYYLKSLEKQGIDTSKVDWSSHKIDSKAGDYAQQQVDRQQNVSDIDLQGKVFRSKNPSIQFARKALLPFSNFLMNQKTRMYSDLTIVTSKTATKEDKIAAWKSLGGLAAETVTFNLLGLYIIQGLVLLSAENDEDAEEKLKRFNNRKKGRAGQALKDIISPLPLGIIDEPLVKGINTLIRVASDSDDPYQFFEAQPKDAWDNLGLYSIPLTRFDEWLEMTNMAINGNYEVTGPFGKKTTKKLNGAGKGDMLGNWLGYTAYSAGFLPAEAGTIARNNVKYIKKNKTKK